MKDSMGGALEGDTASAPEIEDVLNSTEAVERNEMVPLTGLTLAEAAVEYLHRGFTPVPMHWAKESGECSCGRSDCTSIGKHPRVNWREYQDKAPSPKMVVAWWRNAPQANVGLVTTGMVVVDVDGDEGFAALEAAGYDLPPTVQVKTGRGSHLYYERPEGIEIRNRAGIVRKVDVRADGGVIVAPPSMHASGVQYEWVHEPGSIPLAPCPVWVYAKSEPERPSASEGPASSTVDAGDLAIPTQRDAMRVLDELCARVRWAEEGTRNTTLNICAFKAGALLERGLDVQTAYDRFHAAAVESGLAPHAADSTIRSAFVAGHASAREPFACDEQALAMRFKRVCSHLARYSAAEGRWRIFDGSRWAMDTTGRHLAGRMMEEVIGLYLDDAQRAPEDVSKAMRKFVKSYRTHGKVMSAVSTAERQMIIDSDLFDEMPHGLNVLNGTLDLRTAELRPASSEDYLTRIAGVAFDPEAQAPRFARFLAETLPDSSVRDWLQRFCGYVLAGQPSEQCFCTFLGEGSNGKSTLLAALSHVLGEYAMTTQADTFLLGGRGSSHVQEMARMGKAVRLLISCEPPAKARLDESFLKQFAGGDEVTGKPLYSPAFTFRPQAVLVMAANDPLELSTSNVALTRRIKVVPFEVIIREGERDKLLSDVLRSEGAGILNWMIEGYRAYLERGLSDEPEAVRSAAADYIRSSDTFMDFFEKSCEVRKGAAVKKSSLYESYVKWCRVHDVEPRSNHAVASSMRSIAGVAEKKIRGERYWENVTRYVNLRDPFDDEESLEVTLSKSA